MQLSVDQHTILRTWSDEDAPTLFSLTTANRELLAQWLPWVPSIQQENDSLRFIQADNDDPIAGETLEFGIWHQDTLVGCLGLRDISRQHKHAKFGYWLGKDFHGKGLMTTSCRALLNYCFDELDLNRIEIRAAVENLASQNVAKRLGFSFEGVLREAELVQNRFLDLQVYSKLKSDVENIDVIVEQV